jgi:hypothetical protein
MSLSAAQQASIRDFREWFERALATDERFDAPVRDDRADLSTLATRWPTRTNPHVWIEVAVRPFLPQLRVGLLTDDRWKSEDLEEKIQESGDSMSEFVGLAFEEHGLPWAEPPVEHYRDQMKFFYFATPVELESLDDLAGDAVRIKARQMLDGYYAAFAPFLK